MQAKQHTIYTMTLAVKIIVPFGCCSKTAKHADILKNFT